MVTYIVLIVAVAFLFDFVNGFHDSANSIGSPNCVPRVVPAETGGAMSILLATTFGIPVSTTHTISGSIVGVGTASRISAVRWGIAGRIVWAWVLTIPAAALMAALSLFLLQLFIVL